MAQSNLWPTQEQLWLLKAALFHNLEGKKAWGKWHQKVDFDRIDHASYKLLGLVSKNPFLQSVKDPLFEKCRGVYRRTWVSNQLTWNQIRPLLSRLNSPVVLLKGIAMLLHYYRDFGVRVIGDVDFLVKREDLLTAYSFLESCGWESTYRGIDVANEEHLKRWHALNLSHSSGLNLDLHWSFIFENSPFVDDSVWHHAERKGQFFIPDATNLLFQCCIHGTKQSAVPLIRWIADAVVLIRHGRIDWDRLFFSAAHAHVCLPLYNALLYIKEHFDAAIPVESLKILKKNSSFSLESKEWRSNIKGCFLFAAWYRYCLNRDLTTFRRQIRHLIPYLQLTARLRSPWLLPFFSIYWVLKRGQGKIFLLGLLEIIGHS